MWLKLKSKVDDTLTIVVIGWFAICILSMAYHFVAVPVANSIMDLFEPERPAWHGPELTPPDSPLHPSNLGDPNRLIYREWD